MHRKCIHTVQCNIHMVCGNSGIVMMTVWNYVGTTFHLTKTWRDENSVKTRKQRTKDHKHVQQLHTMLLDSYKEHVLTCSTRYIHLQETTEYHVLYMLTRDYNRLILYSFVYQQSDTKQLITSCWENCYQHMLGLQSQLRPRHITCTYTQWKQEYVHTCTYKMITGCSHAQTYSSYRLHGQDKGE